MDAEKENLKIRCSYALKFSQLSKKENTDLIAVNKAVRWNKCSVKMPFLFNVSGRQLKHEEKMCCLNWVLLNVVERQKKSVFILKSAYFRSALLLLQITRSLRRKLGNGRNYQIQTYLNLSAYNLFTRRTNRHVLKIISNHRTFFNIYRIVGSHCPFFTLGRHQSKYGHKMVLLVRSSANYRRSI